MAKKDENADSSPADEIAESSPADVSSESSSENDSASQVENAADEKTSQSVKDEKPSGRDKWMKKLTAGRGEDAKPETPEVVAETADEPEADAETTSETETEETVDEQPAEEVEAKTSTLSDEEFIKRLKPETARRFKERNDRITALHEENTNLKPLAAVGQRIRKVLDDNQIPEDHFESWTEVGVRVNNGDPSVVLQLFNMAKGLAKDLGIELPKELPATEHPAYKKLKDRLTANVRAGTMSHEEAEEALGELAGTLGPVQSQPATSEARRPEVPRQKQAPPAASNRVSIFADPPMPADIKSALDELERKDKAMEQLHKPAIWKPIQSVIAKKMGTMQEAATKAGKPIPPHMFPVLFDQLVEAEFAIRKSQQPVKAPPKVPPTLKPTNNTTAGKNGDGKSGRAKVMSILT